MPHSPCPTPHTNESESTVNQITPEPADHPDDSSGVPTPHPELTTAQKDELSDMISKLDANKHAEVLELLKDYVQPKDAETEVQFDLNSLDTSTAHKVYEFVKSQFLPEKETECSQTPPPPLPTSSSKSCLAQKNTEDIQTPPPPLPASSSTASLTHHLHTTFTLPDGQQLNPWISHHIRNFYKDLTHLYATIADTCTLQRCPRMTPEPVDNANFPNPIHAAFTLLDQRLLAVTSHHNGRTPYPYAFLSHITEICGLMLQVLGHAMHAHLAEYKENGLEGQLRSCLKGVVVFCMEFGLVGKDVVQPLEDLIRDLTREPTNSTALGDEEVEEGGGDGETGEVGILRRLLQSLRSAGRNIEGYGMGSTLVASQVALGEQDPVSVADAVAIFWPHFFGLPPTKQDIILGKLAEGFSFDITRTDEDTREMLKDGLIPPGTMETFVRLLEVRGAEVLKGGHRDEGQIFVGNFPLDVEWTDLEDLFGAAGSILSGEIFRTASGGLSRGAAKVTFVHPVSAQTAVTMFHDFAWKGQRLVVSPDTEIKEDISDAETAPPASKKAQPKQDGPISAKHGEDTAEEAVFEVAGKETLKEMEDSVKRKETEGTGASNQKGKRPSSHKGGRKSRWDEQ